MEKKITAVEWFEQQLDNLDIEIPQSIFDEAKEIEKQQMIDFYEQGCIETYGVDEPSSTRTDREYADDFYKMTFKK